MRALILGSPRSLAERIVAPLCQAAGMQCRTFHPPGHDTMRGDGPSMSMREYQAKFGDDIDFAAVALILAEVHQGYSSRTFLELDSPLYRRLRGIAAEVDAVMTDFRPDVVLTSGLLSTAQIHVAKAMRHRAAPLFWGGSVIPGDAFILDRRAPYNIPRVNSLDIEWGGMSSSQSDLARGAEYVAKWRAARQTRPEYKENPSEVRRLNAFLRGDAPVLLFALQVVSDLNILMHLPPEFDGDYPAWVDAVLAAVPGHWKVIVKKHPRTWYAPRLSSPNHFAADQLDIHRLFERCDCALTVASNMGMETALAGAPSIVCGRPFYSDKGITADFAGENAADYAEKFPALLNDAPTRRPPADALNRFAHRALLEYHCWPDESAKVRAVCEKARDCPSDVIGDSRRPFLELYPRRMRRYAALVNEFSALNLSRPTPGEIAAHWWRRRRHAWIRSLRKRLPF